MFEYMIGGEVTSGRGWMALSQPFNHRNEYNDVKVHTKINSNCATTLSVLRDLSDIDVVGTCSDKPGAIIWLPTATAVRC